MASSSDNKYLAVGEGSENPTGKSNIFLYDLEKKKLANRLGFHTKGIQCLAFSNDSKFLISVSVQGENTLAIWDINQGLVV